MNNISEEYGKYFKLVSYEVWTDENNSELLKEASNYLKRPTSGVPYIIIGDKVFIGYGEKYSDDIKDAIVSLYNTPKKDRYDVFEEMKNNPIIANTENKENTEKKEVTNKTTVKIALTILSVIIVIIYAKLKKSNNNIGKITNTKSTSNKKGKTKK